MGEPWVDEEGKESIPDEETNNGVFGDVAFLPGDFGMSNISDNSGNCGSDEHGEPNKVIVVNDEIGKNRIETIIENSNCDTDYKVASGVFASFDITGSRGLIGAFVIVASFFGFFLMLAKIVGSHIIDD